MSDKIPQPLDWLAASNGDAALPADGALRGAFPSLLRRVAGDGAVNLLCAKTEVEAALRAGGGVVPAAPALDDALRPELIPSVAQGRWDDRILAEIDQDGFAFADDPIDAPFFERRAERRPRPQNRVHIALVERRVCIRKEFRPLRIGARRWGQQRVPAAEWLRRKVWASLGLYLYNEAAALLRLHDLPFVPKLRRIDFAERAIFVDCITGITLRDLAAKGGAAVHDHDLAGEDGLAGLTARELDRREVRLLDAAGGGGEFRREIAAMAREINARGVAPLDIKLGNFIRGSRTGRLYWIDFEISRLGSQPRWEDDLQVQHALLQSLFA